MNACEQFSKYTAARASVIKEPAATGAEAVHFSGEQRRLRDAYSARRLARGISFCDPDSIFIAQETERAFIMLVPRAAA